LRERGRQGVEKSTKEVRQLPKDVIIREKAKKRGRGKETNPSGGSGE